MQDDLIERSAVVRSELWAVLIANDEWHKAMIDRIAALEADKVRLKGLVPYVQHKGGCRRGIWPHLTPAPPCDCGLSEALAKIKEATDA